MKKQNIFIALIITGVIAFTACTNSTPKTPVLKTQLDSLSYAFGLANGQGVKMNSLQGKGDSIEKKLASILKGIEIGIKREPEKDPQLSMTISQFSNWMTQQDKSFLGDSLLKFNYGLFKQGVINGLHKSEKVMTPEKIQEYVGKIMKARYEKEMEKKYGAQKAAGAKFIAENGKRPGVITTASGLQYEVITKGTGPMPKENDNVKVNYVGKLMNDTIFDSSYKRNEPAIFNINQVIPGWTEGLKLMPVGSKFKFYIPQELAYGAQQQPTIPAFSPLIFEVELLSIEKVPEQTPTLQPAELPTKK